MSQRIKYLLIVLAAILFVLGASLLVYRLLNRGDRAEPQNITLTYWGLFEPPDVMEPLISNYVTLFEENNPGSTLQINYEQRFFDSLEEHRETVLNRLTSEGGPDIFRIHSTWIPQFAPEISPLPSGVMSLDEYDSSFYRVAGEQAVINGQVYALPLMYDGLVLLVNEDLFIEAGLAVPSIEDKLTWFEFSELSRALTKRDRGRITQAGAAIGLANNVPHASDILGLMMAQVGIDSLDDLEKSLKNGETSSAVDALKLYVAFYSEDNVWNDSFLSSIDAFINGQVAMIFVPSWRVVAIEELNPGLNMKTTVVPQVPSTTESVTNWASFWVESVSKDSTHPEVAWDFLKFLSSAQSQKTAYSLETQLRDFGEPYSRAELAGSLASHKYLGALMAEAPTATTWLATDASGNGPYVEIINNAITRTATGSSALDQLTTAEQTIRQLARRNNVIK